MKLFFAIPAILVLASCATQPQTANGQAPSGKIAGGNNTSSKESCKGDSAQSGEGSRPVARTPKEVLYRQYNKVAGDRDENANC